MYIGRTDQLHGAESFLRNWPSASQEIHGILWNTEVHYRVSILSHVIQVHSQSYCFSNVHFDVFRSTFRSSKQPFLSGFPFKPVILFHFNSYNRKLLLLLCHHSLSSSVQQFSQFLILFRSFLQYRLCLADVIFPLTSNCKQTFLKCYLFQSYNKTNEMHYFTNLFWYRTLRVSDRFTVHHQESTAVYTAIGICQTGYADSQHN